ncbi:MAG TPA: hypothetical protein VIH61_02755 [Waddliaceae bacterium]
MNVVLGKAAVSLGWEVLKVTAHYGSAVISGHAGMRIVNATVNSFADRGKLYGPAGKFVGNFFGKVVAGQGITATQSQVQMFNQGLGSVGIAIINAAAPAATEKSDIENNQGTSLASRAFQVGKVAAVVAGGVAVAGGLVPAATVGLVSAAATALPKIAQSAMTTPKPQEQQADFVENIVVRAAKTVITESAATLVGNYVRCDQVLKAYDFRCQQGKFLGENIFGSYTPDCMKNVTAKVGELAGAIDAGRYAMSDETIKKACDTAETAEQMVKAGLGVVSVVTAKALEQPSSSNWDTARKTLWVAGAVLCGAALVVVAPEVAPFVAGTATLSAASDVITWAKSQGRTAKALPTQEKSVSEVANSEGVEDFVVVE